MATYICKSHADYTIAWICALPVEMVACKAMLDCCHVRLRQPKNDHNVYTLGEVNGHNVVIACLPLGVYGIASASLVATQVLATFPEIRFCLLIGVGGGVPSADIDSRLGDVVVSRPTGAFGGVVQYDYGKSISRRRFLRTGVLNKPPTILLSAMSALESDHMTGDTHIPEYLSQLMDCYSTRSKFSPPEVHDDIVFEAGYEHVTSPNGSCFQCSKDHIVYRDPRPSSDPHIHYGLIASGNQVMRDGVTRDEVSHDFGGAILCFEMEATGLMDNFPFKLWQPYAAATAAAYAKDLLSVIPVREVHTVPAVENR
ncbi:purine and uridine phosphorylase [Aspergillus crustosus]